MPKKLTNKNTKALVINLKRRPDRLQTFMEEVGNHLNFNLEVIEATDGKLINVYSEPYLWKVSTWDINNRLKASLQGVVGCCVSHRDACLNLVNSKYQYALIFEDDATPVIPITEINQYLKNIELPEKFGIIYFNHFQKRFTDYTKLQLAKYKKLFITHEDFPETTESLLISRNFAKIFLTKTEEFIGPVDFLYNQVSKENPVFETYIFQHELFEQKNKENDDTDIQLGWKDINTINRPKICLNMIVKNEIAVIEKCLLSVLPIIDSWAIVDTGSTDGTQEKIKEILKDVPGVLYQRNWVDFAFNRTEAINLAKKHHTDYLLFIDADATLHIPENYQIPHLNKDAYYITHLEVNASEVQNLNDYEISNLGGFRYNRIDLVKTSLDWKYIGVLHECIDCATQYQTEQLDNLIILDSRSGSRNNDPLKYHKDAEILEKALLKEPNNARYLFYLAQSYRDSNNTSKAIINYQKRVDMGGWEEEVYYSLLQIAKLKESNDYPFVEIEQAYLKAINFRPTRHEAAGCLARFYRKHSQYDSSYQILQKSLNTTPSQDILFVDQDHYNWILADEYAIASYYLGKYTESLEACNKLLANAKLPATEIQRIQTNRQFSVDKLLESQTDSILATNKKPIITLYLGYAYLTKAHTFGAEHALIQVGKYLSQFYDVHLFGYNVFPNEIIKESDGIVVHETKELSNFANNNLIETMIVVRYIHYFIEFDIQKIAKSTILWVHDPFYIDHWDFKSLPNGGTNLVNNCLDTITTVVCISDWQRDLFVTNFSLNKDKTTVIPNGINPDDFINLDITKKDKDSFIWASSPDRGLQQMIESFLQIRQDVLPNATLKIFGGTPTDFDINKFIQPYPFISYGGKVDNKTIITQMAKTEYWYYPTNATESSCISAMEAQAAGCICVASNLAALQTTIADRGVLIKSEIYSKEYWQEAKEIFIDLKNNPQKKTELSQKARAWVIKNNSWQAVGKNWHELLVLLSNT